MTALCQEAALLTMKADIYAPYVSILNLMYDVNRADHILRSHPLHFWKQRRISRSKSRRKSYKHIRTGETGTVLQMHKERVVINQSKYLYRDLVQVFL